MPADFSALLDTLLVLAGLTLVVSGLVMFIYSKTSTQASSVEAFGIKLNVTHPSLILVLAGVGLMLAPRLLPDPGGKAEKPEPAVVASQAQPAAPPGTVQSPPSSQPVATAPSSPPEASRPGPAATPAKTGSAPAAQAVLPAKPTLPAKPVLPAAPKISKPATPKPSKAVTPTIAAVPHAPATPAPAVSDVPASPPPVAVKPARPTLDYAALGLPIGRSFWSGETRASYTRRMDTVLQQAGRDVLRMDAHKLELDLAEFNDWWNESNQHPKSRERCAAPQAPLALLSARVETPMTISSIESAYWPELKLRLFVCANQRLYRQQKTLSPQNDDTWPFSVELTSEIERFLRTYRGDLTQ